MIKKEIKEKLAFIEENKQGKIPVIPEKIFQAESFDRIIRTEEELKEKINYISNNPVKKGLCQNGNAYKWMYLNTAWCNLANIS
jgi:hypothetical protein